MPRLASLITALFLLSSPWGNLPAQDGSTPAQVPSTTKVDSSDFDYDKTKRQLRMLEHQLNVERQKLEAMKGRAKTFDDVTKRSAQSTNETVTPKVVNRNRDDAWSAQKAAGVQRDKVRDLESRVAALKEVMESSGGRTDKAARMKAIEGWIADNRAQRSRGTTEFDLERAINDYVASVKTTAKCQARIQDIEIQVKLADQAGAAALNQERQRMQEDLTRQSAQRELLTLQYHRYLLLTMDVDDPLQQAAAVDGTAVKDADRGTSRDATRSMADFKKDYDELRPALNILRKDRAAGTLSDEGAKLMRHNLIDNEYMILGITGATPRLYRAVMGKPAPPSLVMFNEWAIQQEGNPK